jgi:hypothetical protein
MKSCVRLTTALALLCVAMSTAMLASDNAYMYLVNGIPGRDYSTSTDPQFPIDVLFNDEICYEHGLPFGTITGPLTFIPGSYDVKVSLANTLAPCSNSPLVDSTVTADGAQDVLAVVSLSETGTPTLVTFANAFSAVPANTGRVLFVQAADAPAVTVVFTNTTTMKTYTYTANPDALLNESFTPGTYTVQVNQGTTTLVPATTIELYSQSVTMLFAVGEASNNTVNLESKTVRNVI